ncbi:MAG: GNAT family N-acetyltransferase [Candidatus Sabulitectum sp.]|nr:GNAT family N-acetyltransferase [Candidatus Sabulitectum sp.]
MNLSLRRFEEKDLVQLDSWSHAVGAYKYMQKITPLNYSSPDDLSQWGKDFVWFAITIDHEAIGGVWVDRRRPGDTLGILGILIGRPDILGKGIGRRSITTAIREAVRILGITRVRLTVRKANERAIRAYRSVGFEVSGQGTTTLDDGTSIPFYRMESDVTEELATAI